MVHKQRLCHESEAIEHDGEASGEFCLQVVPEMGHHLAHVRDGSLLHLLVDVLSLEADVAALVDVVGEGGEVESGGGGVEGAENLHQLLKDD